MKAIGDQGEETAKYFIESKYGWELLDQNWRCKQGEIDIIYYDNVHRIIHFIEVKQRKMSVERALTSITYRQSRRLFRAAQQWLALYNKELYPCQFDIVAISNGSVELRQNILSQEI